MTEIELLHNIKNNPSYFSKLFEMYYKAIFGYVLRRTGNFDESADIAADTFSKAFTHINNFDYKGIPVKVWLYRIATNEVNLFYRNKRKQQSLFERINFDDKSLFNNYLQDDKTEMEIELQKHEQFQAVLKNLKTLPVKYQEVISMRYFEGFDNKTISEILNINIGTLKSLLSRGTEKLREKCNNI